MKKLYYILSFSLFFLCSCAQKKEIKSKDFMNEPNVQKVANIYKEIQTYKYNPVYLLHMNTAGGFCYELLINDYLIHWKFIPGTMTGTIPLKSSILRSGKQKLKLRMYPPVDKEYNRQSLIIPREVGLKFRIVYGDEKRDKPNAYPEVLKFELPALETALPYYEVNLEFDAQVPYELQGWTNGVDLTEEDKDSLQKEVEDYYKKMIHLYDTQDVNGLAGKYYFRQKEMGQALYETLPEDYQYILDYWAKQVNRNQKFEFEDYELRFYGDGKMVALIRNDKYYRGESALFAFCEEDYLAYNIFLYRPYPGAALEVAR